MPLLWQDPGDFRSNGMWPRLTTHTTGVFDSLSACDYTVQGPAAAERQRYLKSLSQQSLSYHDKLSLLLLQSPKSVMPSNSAYPRVQQYPSEGLGGLMGDSLSLAPSSTGVGVLPGLDTTPATRRGVTRVTDSGRALSLLSLQTQGPQAPDVLMHDPPGLANIAAFNHQLGHHEEVIVPQQFLLQGGPHYYDDVSVEKSMVTTPFSSLQAQSSSAHLGSLMTFDRDLGECSFGHDSNRQASNHPLFALLPYHQQDQREGAAG